MDWRSEDLHLEHDHVECEKDWAELAHVKIINAALLELVRVQLGAFDRAYEPESRYTPEPWEVEWADKARAAVAQAKGENR